MDMIRIFLSVFLATASCATGVQLMRGKWTGLVYSFASVPAHELEQSKMVAVTRARAASPVAFCFLAADATLLIFEIARQLAVYEVAGVFSILCDIAMVAFVVATISFYVRSGATQDKQAKFRSSTVRMNLFVLAHVVLLTLLALMF